MATYELSLGERMLDAGYVQSWIDPIDAEVVNEVPCPECGGQCYGRGYRSSTGGYRAFAVCSECGNEEEF